MSGVARNPVRSAQWRVPDSYYLRACQRGIGSFGYRESANKLTWALPAPRRVAVEPGTRELPASSVRSLGLMLLSIAAATLTTTAGLAPAATRATVVAGLRRATR